MWPARAEAERNARVERGKYKCAFCEKIVGPGEYRMDHIESVIDVETGFVDWNSYISRLFIGPEGFQLLCIDCNHMKTLMENELRNQHHDVDNKDDFEDWKKSK